MATNIYMGTAVAQWLRCCSTNRKVAVRSKLVSLEFFIDIKSSDRTMALGSTQSLTEMSTGAFSGGKGGRCVKLTILPLSRAVVMKFGNRNFLEPSRPLQTLNGTIYIYLFALNEKKEFRNELSNYELLKKM